MITITLVDDHKLISHAISKLIQIKEDYKVISIASNGKDFINQLEKRIIPQIAIIDIQMPVMNGIETTHFIHNHYPSIKIIGLSALCEKKTIIKMKTAGAYGFISKNAEPNEFWEIINTVSNGNLYFPKNTIQTESPITNFSEFEIINDKEKQFLALCSTELTYKEIAEKMNVKTRTIDNYRDSLFEKLNVVSRAGLILYAIKNKIVEL